MFLSADKAQGNPQGVNPYGYVGGNPETRADPSGQYVAPPTGGGGPPPSCSQLGTCNTIGGGTPNAWTAALTFSTQVWWPVTSSITVLSPSMTAALSVKPVSTPSSSSSGNDPISRSITSCNVPGGSQASCGDYGVFYALYTSSGVVPLPGSFCFFCSPGGGGDTYGEGTRFNDLTSLMEEDSGSASSLAASASVETLESWGSHDPELQWDLLTVAEDIRNENGWTSTSAYEKNLAFIANTDLVALSGRYSPEGTVGSPEEDYTFEVTPGKEFHAEVKLLEYQAANYNGNVTNLFTEIEPCEACQNVIQQYRDRFGESSLQVEWYYPRYYRFVS